MHPPRRAPKRHAPEVLGFVGANGNKAKWVALNRFCHDARGDSRVRKLRLGFVRERASGDFLSGSIKNENRRTNIALFIQKPFDEHVFSAPLSNPESGAYSALSGKFKIDGFKGARGILLIACADNPDTQTEHQEDT